MARSALHWKRTQHYPSPLAVTNRPTQPASFVYGSDMTNVSAYAHPGGFLVAGRDNYQDAALVNAAANGATVLIYLDAIIDVAYGRYHSLLLENSVYGGAVPLWPGVGQVNAWGSLNDFRVGGILQSKLEAVLELMVSENPHMAGWFADDIGSRSWFAGLDWNGFGTTNQQDYRAGAIALCQTFRTVADRHGLIFMVNGTWGGGTLSATGGGYPVMGSHGNALADGALVEYHDASELAYFVDYASSSQWAAQSPITTGTSFMWSVHNTDSDRDAYIASDAFAFCNTQSDYNSVPIPWSSFHPTGLPHNVGS